MKIQSIFLDIFKAMSLVAVLSIASCNDDDDHHANQATITISAPTAHTTFSQGNTVHMEGMAVGEQELHGYELYILNKTSGDTVFSFHEHQHGDTLHFHEHWVVNAVGDMEFGIIVTLDHENNLQKETVEFHCN